MDVRRVFIVGDSLFAETLAQTLAGVEAVEIAGSAPSAEAALPQIAAGRPGPAAGRFPRPAHHPHRPQRQRRTGHHQPARRRAHLRLAGRDYSPAQTELAHDQNCLP